MRLIHITDPHLTSLDDVAIRSLRGKRLLGYLAWQRKRRRFHRNEVLAALTDAVASEQADHIAISGDLAHLGLPSEILAARSWLERLGSPDKVTLVPGNHDVYAEDSWPAIRAHWMAYLDSNGAASGSDPRAHYPVTRTCKDVAIIHCQSAVPKPILMASGTLGADQIAGIAGALRETGAQGLFRCVVIHHPPVPGITGRRRALTDNRQLATVLRECGAELVLHGHIHENQTRHFANIPVYATAAASWMGPKHAASYRVFDIETTASGWRVIASLKQLQAANTFMPIAQQVWELDADARRHAGYSAAQST